jgi:hypothetical protein
MIMLLERLAPANSPLPASVIVMCYRCICSNKKSMLPRLVKCSEELKDGNS